MCFSNVYLSVSVKSLIVMYTFFLNCTSEKPCNGMEYNKYMYVYTFYQFITKILWLLMVKNVCSVALFYKSVAKFIAV